MAEISNKISRIESIDALRGFAVFAILLVHCVEHFIFPVYPTSSPEWLATLDKVTSNIIFTLFAGKAYAIFALLFGFTFYIQYTNQKRRGEDFGYRFLWRLAGLALLATINAAFFPGGDILLLYAIVGVELFVVRKLNNSVILALAILFLLQPFELYNYIATLVDSNHVIQQYGVGAMYEKISEVSQNGIFWEFLKTNVTLGQKASLMWAVEAGRASQTAGLFLLGLLLGRKKKFINTPQNQKFWQNALIISAISYVVLYSLYVMITKDYVSQAKTIGVAVDMWQKLSMTFVLVSSFMILTNRGVANNQISKLSIYGRMSLTNYITQSIIGLLIFYPFGLFLSPYLGHTFSVVIAILIFILQLNLCKLWMKTHKQGPFENIWRRWTWINK
ncbi:MAG: DUF418 domain-containing protein [Bacteroidales bacterium]|nr:DUF418 domain-containing protein [Bacteroidales bacterium]